MSVLGLDVGGAHLKAAHAGGWTRTLPFELWREPDRLGSALEALVAGAPPHERIGASMTGELCDCFATHREGVAHITRRVEAAARVPVRYWSTAGAWLAPEAARARPEAVAAANWHAQATVLAARQPETAGLLVDTGSTTTDVIPFAGGRPAARALTDTGRLASGELVYVGGERTDLMALGPEVDFRGARHGVMAERFATIADARLALAELPPDPKDHATCDGRPRTRGDARRRVLRMVGADPETATAQEAEALATAFVAEAAGRIAGAVARALEGRRAPRVIVSGSGAPLAARAVRSVRPGAEIECLGETIGPALAEAACAWALAHLEVPPFA